MTAGAVEGEDGTGTELELRYQRVWSAAAADFHALLSWLNKVSRYGLAYKY